MSHLTTIGHGLSQAFSVPRAVQVLAAGREPVVPLLVAREGQVSIRAVDPPARSWIGNPDR